MAERFCRVCKGWHDTSAPWPAECIGHFGAELHRGPQSDVIPLPMVISDQMDPTLCMADGLTYESKRAMSRTHRRMGFIEVGNEKQPLTLPKPKVDGVKRAAVKALQDWNQGRRPGMVH